MAEVMEENRRLKLYLEQIMKEYRSLQTRFHEIMNNNQQDHDPHQQQQQSKKSADSVDNESDHDAKGDNEDDDDEHDLVSLSLGRSPSRELKRTSSANVDVVKLESCLSLTLDYCRFQGSGSGDCDRQMAPQPKPGMGSSGFEGRQGKEELGAAGGRGEAARDCSPAKAGDGANNNEEQHQNPAKKARVSVRARCDTPTMNDGCQWRKYGQKIAKGNPCPRAYYRCTVGPSCPVRKQVQRCADDMSILITTYEGNHNHPLPMSATTMASTTSAAASMLLSGSSSSSSTAAVPGNLHGLNMYVSDNNNNMNSISSRPPFYFSNNNNNNSPYSPSPSYPTITLDLTSTNNNNILNTSSSPPHSSSSHSNYARFSSRFAPASSLNFGAASEPATWGLHNGAGILNYGIGNVGRSGNAAHYRMSGPAAGPSSSSSHHNQSMLADSTMVAAATKAITADPSFQSALAAALTSIIGKNNNSSGKVVTSSSRGGGDQPSYLMNVKASGDANTAPSSTTSLSRTGSLSHHGQSAAGSGLVFQAPSSSSSSSSPHSYSMPAFTAAARDASTSPSEDN
ncbi:unnamed protein product [Linum tenue]|uniref:WRKY domain-containing protein n=1 Tax=Linum tenue TaxID=586396 RepID=A0AAV0IP26_9ROSI|nr:unnamed protein product [Linum tenue]